jgi:hypothetical protein
MTTKQKLELTWIGKGIGRCEDLQIVQKDANDE